MKNKLLKSRGVYEILGGVLGLIVLFMLLAKTGQIAFVEFLFFIFYSLLIVAGASLIANRLKTGHTISLGVQLVQLFSFVVSGFAFRFVGGTTLALVIKIEDRKSVV